jgi:CRP-like cAMP-binding protein
MSLSQSSVRNLLLSRLDPEAFGALGDIDRVPLPLKYVQQHANEPISHVYFGESGLSSKVAITASGERLEVGIIGQEGMTGTAVLLGDDRSPHETFIQVAGEGVRISADGLRRAAQASASLRQLFLRFAQALSIQVAHTALANGRYSLSERLARWLLMSQDRVGAEIPLTHEFLSLMLGVRRAGVTEALQALEEQRAIRSTRRLIHVLDRAKLEQIAGDCYGTPEAEYLRLIGVAICREVPPN